MKGTLSVAILAGGLATRLKPITETIPKAMIEVAGRPFIDWQLEYIQLQGFERVVLCVGHLGDSIEGHIRDGSRFGLQVEYSRDGENLLGTGGALKAASCLLGERFLILYGDSFLPVNFKDVQAAFDRSGGRALMTVLRNEGKWDKSNAEFKGGKVVTYSKRSQNSRMLHIDYGLNAMEGRALDDWPNGPFDLADVFENLATKRELAGYEVFSRFYEIGSRSGLEETERYLRSRGTGELHTAALE